MSLIKKNLIILLCVIYSCTFAQNEASNWFFGSKAGLSFSSGKLVNLSSESQINAPAGCSSISDNNGNLLFYTNGETIWNKKHNIMENGNVIAGNINSNQSSIIIPQPNSDSIYYLFTNKEKHSFNPFFTSGIYYSVVEISDTYPLGKVINKNNRLTFSSSSEKLSAVHHKDGNSIWVIALTGEEFINDNLKKNTFRIFNIDNTGIKVPALTKTIDAEISSGGAMKISPDGKTIAIADFTKQFMYFYDFNNSTGETSYVQKYSTVSFFKNPESPYGIEFSADSKFLYYTTTNNSAGKYTLFQYELNKINISFFPTEIHKSYDIISSSLQLAIDGKIYVALSKKDDEGDSPKFLGVINNPENLGVDCNYLDQSINISSGLSEKGLPNFIQSYFKNRIIAENGCVSSFINFSTDSYTLINSINWDFGDGNHSTVLEPNHKYMIPGTYNVSAKININNKFNYLYKSIRVFPIPPVIDNQRLTQCDDDDGTSYFDLSDIKNKIIAQDLEYTYNFYESKVDAENNENKIPNPEKYKNKFNPQEIYVRISNRRGCYSFTSFLIETTNIKTENIENMTACEDSDSIIGNSEGVFNLKYKRDYIRTYFDIPETTSINFYKTQLDAQLTVNELNETFISAKTVIWVRFETSIGCGGISSFKLIVSPSPSFNIEGSYTICSDFPAPIFLDGGVTNDKYEWKKDDNIISTNQELILTEIGTYSLTAYKTENGFECSRSKIFTIKNAETPKFDQIIIEESLNYNTVFVDIEGNSNYEFSIDGLNYFGNDNSYTFTNINYGTYTISVKDINKCESEINTKIHIIGYPKFFTPNNDGHNDYWQVKGVDDTLYSFSSTINIFNRFGKYLKTINILSVGWDGLLNGSELPSGEYWYSTKLIETKGLTVEKHGHFSLIRR
jgi:gliding motility-associated-like protein